MDITPIYESLSSATEVIGAFKSRIAELSTSDFSSENPRLFLDILLRLINVLETRLFLVYLKRAHELARQTQTPENLGELQILGRNISLILDSSAKSRF